MHLLCLCRRILEGRSRKPEPLPRETTDRGSTRPRGIDLRRGPDVGCRKADLPRPELEPRTRVCPWSGLWRRLGRRAARLHRQDLRPNLCPEFRERWWLLALGVPVKALLRPVG